MTTESVAHSQQYLYQKAVSASTLFKIQRHTVWLQTGRHTARPSLSPKHPKTLYEAFERSVKLLF